MFFQTFPFIYSSRIQRRKKGELGIEEKSESESEEKYVVDFENMYFFEDPYPKYLNI